MIRVQHNDVEGECKTKLSVQNLLYPHVHEILEEVIIIQSNFNAVRSILKRMIQAIFFIRVRMIMHYTSLDS